MHNEIKALAKLLKFKIPQKELNKVHSKDFVAFSKGRLMVALNQALRGKQSTQEEKGQRVMRFWVENSGNNF